jgi:hypothetical protein
MCEFIFGCWLGEDDLPCRATVLQDGLLAARLFIGAVGMCRRDWYGTGRRTYFQNMGLKAIAAAATRGEVVSLVR